MLPLDDIESADPRSDVNARPVGDRGRDFQPRMLHRKLRRRQGELDEQAHLLYFILLDELDGVKVLTSAAMVAGKPVGSKCVMVPTPLLPARIFDHVSSVPTPSALTNPTPVTTTLLDKLSTSGKGLPRGGQFLEVFAWAWM